MLLDISLGLLTGGAGAAFIVLGSLVLWDSRREIVSVCVSCLLFIVGLALFLILISAIQQGGFYAS